MTEERIFEFLLPKHHDYPKLHCEAAETIAKSFTDVIYDTLRLKSAIPANKRLNVLKFIKTLASAPDNHVTVDESNCATFIKSLEGQFSDTSDDYLNRVESDLKAQLPKDLSEEVLRFYKRRKQAHEEKIKRLELIKKHDQEALDNDNFLHRVTRSITYYETSENIIKQLLGNESKDQNSPNTTDFNSPDYRAKQVQFAYGLLHLKHWETLLKVLERFKKYETLSNTEQNFLCYLSTNLSPDCDHLGPILVNDFICVYESIVLTFCTQIIQLPDAQIPQFFETLPSDKNYQTLKNLSTNREFGLKLKNLLFELYSFSYCNANLLKFANLFE